MDHIDALLFPQVLLGRTTEALSLIGIVTRIFPPNIQRCLNLGDIAWSPHSLKAELFQTIQNTANSSALTQSWLIEEPKRLIMKFSAPICGPTHLFQVLCVGYAIKPAFPLQRRGYTSCWRASYHLSRDNYAHA